MAGHRFLRGVTVRAFDAPFGYAWRMLKAAALTVYMLCALLIGGCATAEPSALSGARVPAEKYDQTFQAARETLRDYRFALDRVDAPQGVLTTAQRSEPGAMKPWDANSGPAAATNDLIGFQQRTVHVAFVAGQVPTHKPGDPVIPKTDPDRDLVAQPTETMLLVRVAVHRVQRPDRRVSMDSVRVERQAIDPAMRDEGMWPSYLVPTEDDTVLAARLLRAILDRAQTTHPAEQPATTPESKPEPKTDNPVEKQ